MKNKETILKELGIDTRSRAITWDVNIKKEFVRATYTKKLTEDKSIVFKIIYIVSYPKNTRLTILLDKKSVEKPSVIMEIDNAHYIRLNELFNDILNKKDDVFNDLEDQRFKNGDRVVVVEEQDFDGDELGQKGTVISEINDDDQILYLVQFDNHFNDNLIKKTDKEKIGNCWVFKPENLDQI